MTIFNAFAQGMPCCRDIYWSEQTLIQCSDHRALRRAVVTAGPRRTFGRFVRSFAVRCSSSAHPSAPRDISVSSSACSTPRFRSALARSLWLHCPLSWQCSHDWMADQGEPAAADVVLLNNKWDPSEVKRVLDECASQVRALPVSATCRRTEAALRQAVLDAGYEEDMSISNTKIGSCVRWQPGAQHCVGSQAHTPCTPQAWGC